MSGAELIVRSQRVWTGEALEPAAVHLAKGRVIAVSPYDEVPEGAPIDDHGDATITPGLVDTHVHVNEPGRTEWEGFESATRAAAAGGVTSLVDMPLNCIPPTTTRAGLEAKRESTAGKLWIDVGLWGGVVPGNVNELRAMRDGGVLGFKAFLVHSGVDEFPHTTEPDLRASLEVLADLDVPLLVHAELPEPIAAAEAQVAGDDWHRFDTFLKSRPRRAEDEAIAMMIRLSEQTGGGVHIVHHASADSLAQLRDARGRDLPITAETTPHYLHFCAEEVPDGATQYKCTPPIREAENREQLWAALRAGVLDMVVSDHSPCAPDLKRMDTGDFKEAWGGIASLQLGLPVIWTETQKRGTGLGELIEWMCTAPARMAGLAHKGRIAPGFDADLVVWRPHDAFVVEGASLEHRHGVTPYHGETLQGVVDVTYVRGVKVYERGQFAAAPTGRLLAAAG